MSLINQALKKEQQRRDLNLRGSAAHPASQAMNSPIESPRHGRTSHGNSLSILLGFTGLGAVLLVTGGAFVYFGKSYLSDLNPQTTLAQAETGESANAAAPAPKSGLGKVAATIAESDERTKITDITLDEPTPVSTEAAPTTPDSTDSLVSETQPAPAVKDSPVSNPPTPLVPLVQLAPVFDLEVQAYVDELQVIGYRSAGPNSRLLMNGRVYKLDDIVDHKSGLRFKGTIDGNLIFEDSNGAKYEKPL